MKVLKLGEHPELRSVFSSPHFISTQHLRFFNVARGFFEGRDTDIKCLSARSWTERLPPPGPVSSQSGMDDDGG